MTTPTSTSEAAIGPPRQRRRWRRRVTTLLVILAVGGALSWALVSKLVLTVNHRMDRARCHASLSESRQAELVERNRLLIPERVGLPAWVKIRGIQSGPERARTCEWGDTDDGPERVYAMSTRLDLELPALPTVEAWFADHSDNPYGPGLDAAWEKDLYGRFWNVFEHMSRELRTMGFVVQHDVAPSGSLQSRSLSLRGDGVTVDFGFDAASPRISLTRYW